MFFVKGLSTNLIFILDYIKIISQLVNSKLSFSTLSVEILIGKIGFFLRLPWNFVFFYAYRGNHKGNEGGAESNSHFPV